VFEDETRELFGRGRLRLFPASERRRRAWVRVGAAL